MKDERYDLIEPREKCPKCDAAMVKKRQHGRRERSFWRCTACSYKKRIPRSNKYGTGRGMTTTTSTLPTTKENRTKDLSIEIDLSFAVKLLVWLEICILFVPSFFLWLYSIYHMSFTFTYYVPPDSYPLPITWGILCISALAMASGWQIGALHNSIVKDRIYKWVCIVLPLLFIFIISLLYIPIALHYGMTGQMYGRILLLALFLYTVFVIIIFLRLPQRPKKTCRAFVLFRNIHAWVFLLILGVGVVGGSVLVLILRGLSKFILLVI